MLTLYTAVGRLTTPKTQNGICLPVVRLGYQEFALTPREFILWSALAFQILTLEETQLAYDKLWDRNQLTGEADLSYTLRRLLLRGIVVQGKGFTGVDALYRLLAQLHIVPVNDTFILRLVACVRTWWNGRIPLRMLPRYLKKPSCTPLEALILKLSRELSFSVAELLGYMDESNDIPTQKDLDAVTDQLKIDELAEQITIHHVQFPVLQGIANLYLRKQILLER